MAECMGHLRVLARKLPSASCICAAEKSGSSALLDDLGFAVGAGRAPPRRTVTRYVLSASSSKAPNLVAREAYRQHARRERIERP